MSKVFFDNAISLDGFFAGENRGPQNPLGDRGTQIHLWMYKQKAFFKNLGFEGGEEYGDDSRLIDDTFARTGAYVMGKRMFDEGEVNWPEDLYKRDVFVVTREVREPWRQNGSTTFYFINDGLESALEQAKKAAGDRDVRVQGGADIIQQFLNAGLIDEFTIHQSPVMLGSGIRLFDHIDIDRFEFTIKNVQPSALTTHITYEVKRK